MPEISVIMPIYNVEPYLRDSIESVLKQTYKDYELILVNDGSPDNCPRICDEYANRHSNIKVIHKPNGGLSSARNAGVEASTGKYILFLDSDDTIQPDTLDVTVKAITESDADVVIFGVNTVSIEKGEIIAHAENKHASRFLQNHTEIEKSYVDMARHGMWNLVYDKLYSSELIKRNHVCADSFFDRVCEDTAFELDLFPHVSKVVVVDNVLYNYSIRDTQSIVKKFIPERYEKYYGKFCKTKKLMESFAPENQDQIFLYSEYCTQILWAYEMMFHKDCRYSLCERYRYIKKLFSIRNEDSVFCASAFKYYRTTDIYLATSKTSKCVLKYLLRRQYLRAWIIHCMTYIKYRIAIQ